MDGRPRGTTVSRHSIRSSTHWNMPASMPGTARSSGPTANGYRSSSRWSASTLSIRACLATCSKLTCWAGSKTVRQNPAPNTNSRNSTGSSSRGSMSMSARHEPAGSSRELGTLKIQSIAKKKFRWRRPRHTLKTRQIASEVDRIGLRLQLRKRQAEAGDIVLLYGDESEALTHPYLARAWAKSGADLRVPAPGQAKKVAMLGSLDHVTRRLIVHTSPTKRSSDFVAHLEQLDHFYGPIPGRPAKPVVLVEDNGPIHVSKASLAALAARAHWLAVEWLPKYAPELNDIEGVWRDLKAHHLAHQTFTDVDALDQAIHVAVEDLNRERMTAPLVKSRISA